MSVKNYIDIYGDRYDLADGVNLASSVEETSTSTHAYNIGEQFLYMGELYEATQAIAVGGTITPNTNCKRAYLGDEVTQLKSAADKLANEILLTTGDTAIFTWAAPGGTSSNVYLYANTTYTLMSLDDAIEGLLYIEGDTAHSTYMRAKGIKFTFTPVISGYLRFYSDLVSAGTTIRIAVMGALDSKASKPLEFHVGAGKEYGTINSAILAMQGVEESVAKTVYIYAGQYDVYSEMGGDAFVNAMTGSESWRDVNPVIPPNTKIIGIGRVILSYKCPDSIAPEKAILLSCINGSKNVTIENVTVETKNLRYAIHLEGSGLSAYDFGEFVIKNCEITRDAGTYHNAVVGIGLNAGCKLTIEDCCFESKQGDSVVLLHGNNAERVASPSVSLKNTILLGTNSSLYLINTAGRNQIIDTKLYSCYANRSIYKANGTPGQSPDDNYRIIMVNCNSIEVGASNTLQNIIAPEIYNTIT